MLKGPSVRKSRPCSCGAKELYRSLLFSFTFLYKLWLKLNSYDCEATKDILKHLTYALAVCLVPFILPSYLPPPLSHPVSGWVLPPLIIHQLWHKPELFTSQFNSLIWLKTNLTKKREKSIILRLLSWFKEGPISARDGRREEHGKTHWLVAGTW